MFKEDNYYSEVDYVIAFNKVNPYRYEGKLLAV